MEGIGLLVKRFMGVFSGVVFLMAVVLMVQLAGCVELGPSTPLGGGVKSIPRSAALQYRLADNGVFFFQRGTGGGVCRAEILR